MQPNKPGGVLATARPWSELLGLAGTSTTFNVGLLDGTALIAGRAYYDLNINDTLDTSEPAAGSVVTLRNGTTDAVLGTYTVGSDFYYRFLALAAGVYRLTFAPAAGYEGRENAAGVVVAVAANDAVTTNNFG